MIIKVLKMITEIGNSFRTRVFMIFLLTILMAVMEIIGIASIAPFMAVVSSPEIIQQNEYLNLAFNYFNFNGVNDFLISLGFLVILILLFNNIFCIFLHTIICRK